MRWSLKIGNTFGINFRIHVTFFLLLFFIYISALTQRGQREAVLAVLFVCAIFACVLIHEIGHSLITHRFGKEAKSITLLPIGGVATMEEMPEKPHQEILMSIIGPFINLVIAGILFLFVGFKVRAGFPGLYPDSADAFLSGLIGINLILAFFNLIPAFPMDGERVLRGLLAMKMDYVRASSATVSIGQGISMFFIFFGLFYNWWLALIGVFLYVGAGAEKQQVMLRSALHSVPAHRVMATDFRILKPDDTLSHALEHVSRGCQEDFPVVDERGLQGILTRKDMLTAIHEKDINIPISEALDRDFLSVDPDKPLDEVYRMLQKGDKTFAAVIQSGELKGMLCLEGISRYLMIQNTLKGG
jgi:Zn-dependent protease